MSDLKTACYTSNSSHQGTQTQILQGCGQNSQYVLLHGTLESGEVLRDKSEASIGLCVVELLQRAEVVPIA